MNEVAHFEYQERPTEDDFKKILSVIGKENKLTEALSLLPVHEEPPLFQDLLTVATFGLNAKIAVDLGTGWGYSSFGFLPALKRTKGILYTVDKHSFSELRRATPKRLGKLAKEIKKGHAVFIHADSTEVGKKWDKGDIDILFCNTGGGNTANELAVWSRFNPKLIFVHHTIRSRTKVMPLYHITKKWCEENNKKFHHFPIRDGIGMIY